MKKSTHQEDTELDTFCQLEEALREEEKLNGGNEYKQTNLAFEFPDSFVNPDGTTPNPEEVLSSNERKDFHETFIELQQHLADVRRREADLLRDENWVKAEKREIEKEKKKLEMDKMIVAEKLQDAELVDVKEKLERLMQQYQEEKQQWEEEKKALTDKIAQMEKKNRQRVTFITPTFDNKNEKKQESDDENESDQRQSILAQGATSPNSNAPAANSPPGSPTSPSPLVNGSQSPTNSPPGSPTQQQSQQNVGTINLKPAPQQLTIPPNANQDRPQQTTPPTSPRSRKRRNAYRISIHDNYSLDFDYNPGPAFKEEVKRDGRKIVRYKDGSLGTVFRNGTRKIKRSNTTYIFYSNGDVGIEYEDGAVGYRYKETSAIELSLPDKSVIYLFRNGQKEKHYANGDKAIQFPNGVYKVMHANGNSETHHPDGKSEILVNGKLTTTYDYQD